MFKMRLLSASLLACTFLPSCGTANAVRWAYGKTSAFEAPSPYSEVTGLRAIVGFPVILGGALFDTFTFPAQAAFGVWPWWGEKSRLMKPASM